MQQVAAPQPIPPPPPATPRPPGRWLPLLLLLAVMVFVTFGGFLFSGIPSGVAGEVEVGTPVDVAAGVTIQPASGWVVEDHVGDPPGVLLSSGAGLLLAALGSGASPEEVARGYVTAYLEPQARQLSVGEIELGALPAGQAAVISYVGVFEGVDYPIEGEVVGVIGGSGTAVVLDGWAPEGTYTAVADQIVAMAESLRIA